LVHDPVCSGIRPPERVVLRLLQVSDFLDLCEPTAARDRF
jgi:hypothetical protein